MNLGDDMPTHDTRQLNTFLPHFSAKAFFWSLVICLLTAACTRVAVAQQVFGSIVGNVTDPSGAVVPGAAVIIRETTKGVEFKTTTNASGLYGQNQLITGSYVVTVQAPGFKKVVSVPLTVQTDTVSRLNVQLVLGTTEETIVVTDTAPLLQTDRADVSTSFTSQDVVTLPTFQRSALALEFLVPGITFPVGDATAPSENPQGSFRARIGGRVFGATGYQLDGTDNQDAWLGAAIINPNPDSIAEAKFSVQNFDAENGYVSGGVFAFSTKSGSNQLHGSAFEYLINNSPGFRTIGANPFTQPNGAPPVKSNQFGGSLGGPIKREKLFFFVDAQVQRLRNSDTVLATVPTQKVRDTCFTVGAGTCDLSEYLSNGGQVYNPNSGDYLSATPTGKSRTPFANNQIPATLLSQSAINILKYFPAPNTVPANGQLTQNNYIGTVSESFNAQQYDGRLDYYHDTRNLFFGRYTYAAFGVTAPGAFGSLAGGPSPASINFAGDSSIHNQSLSLGYTHTFSSTAVNEFHYGYYRYSVHAVPGGFGSQPATQAGIPNLNLDNTTTSGFPAFYIGGVSNLGYSITANKCNCSLTELEQEHELVDTFSKVYRNHSFKFGADLRRTSNLRAPSDSHRSGELTAAAGYTALNGSSGGLGLATFLFGETTTFVRYVSSITDATAFLERAHFFAQDSWHATSKLTVNYGTRYELTLPEATDSGKGGLLNLQSGLVDVFGVGNNSNRGFQQTAFLNFAPRLGLAYQATSKTVLRAGYGWSYDTGDGGIIFNEANIAYPVVIQQNNTPVNASQGVFQLSNGPITITPPTVNANGQVPLPTGVTGITRPVHESLTATYSYNAAVQQQLTRFLAVTAAYVGNSSRHTENDRSNNVDINQAPFIPGQLAQATSKPYYSKFGFTQPISDFCNCGVNQYNSFEATVDLRGLHGYTARGNYLFQRSYGDGNTAYTFLYNRAAGYGNNNSIYHSQFILTQIVDLPFGKGRSFASNAGPVLEHIIGGWTVSGATVLHSGVPYTVAIGSFPAGYLGENTVNVSFPDRGTGSPYAGAAHNRAQWYQGCTGAALQANTCSGFALPSQSSLGNYGINNLYGPSFVNQDVAVQKTFATIADRYRFLIRTEAFNVFNHTNLSTPNVTLTSTTAGQITAIEGNMRKLQFSLRMDF
jgi:hypothetical protein